MTGGGGKRNRFFFEYHQYEDIKHQAMHALTGLSIPSK